jgi:hypothetical protein
MKLLAKTRCIACLLGLTGGMVLLSQVAFCDTYSWSDEEGTLHFSETPPPPPPKGKKQISVNKRSSDVVSKWTKQKQGSRLYEDSMISVVVTKDVSGLLVFNVMYELPPEMGHDLLNNRVSIAVTPWDLNLPKGVSSYLSSSSLVLTKLSGSVEMQASPTDRTPGGVATQSIAISISVDDKLTGNRRFELWKVISYTKNWS